MEAYNQGHRLLQVDTAAGTDRLLLVAVNGEERISSNFAYDLELVSTDFDIKPDDLLGTPATISLHKAPGKKAVVNGIISQFAISGSLSERQLCTYRARLVPALWFLTRTSNCRIFQDQTVSEITNAILADYNIQHKEWKLNGSYEKRQYCVQYRETAFDFICRLLEEEGIYFYFRHDDKDHTVVFTDNEQGQAKCANTEISIVPAASQLVGIWRWDDTYRFRSSQWALSDFNFEMPSTDLTTHKNTVNPVFAKRPLEMFDYPGRYLKRDPGEALTKYRIEYEEATYREIIGEGNCIGFAAGSCFSVSNAQGADADAEFLLAAVEHTAHDMSLVTQDAAPASYTTRFRCRPRKVPYRPEMKTRPPRIHGTQTAIVTGPSSEEIYTDKYGRIKVQFHWDRAGKKDENTSCWIRVAQVWAGNTWGGWQLPRIGQEVVVAFLEGDPDRPLVVGSVYNAEQMVPFELPANKTQSGLRTRSTLKGSPANVNEFRFEDKKGSELVYLHAEKDTETETENDETHWVGHDETTTVDNDRTEHVKHDETITIDHDRTETVHENETIAIDKNRTETVHENESVTIDKNKSTSVGKDRSSDIGDNESVKAGKTVTITAGDQIVLKTGSASITMKKNGDIIIDGKQHTIRGSGDVILKGKNILQN